MKDYLIEAIRLLKPESEFHLVDNDYSSIEWVVLDGEAPTANQVEAKIIELKQVDDQIRIDLAARKSALLDKLGITEEEATLLLN